MPQQPAPAATASNKCTFLPQYEKNLNENLRSFEHLEGQIGAHTFDKIEDPKRYNQFSWKRCLIIGIPLLFVLALTVCAATLIALRGHSEADLPITPSHAVEAHGPRAPIQSTVYATVTQPIVTVTTFEMKTVLATEAVSSSVPESIVAAVSSSLYDAQQSRIESVLSSMHEHLPISSSIPSSTTTSPSTVPFQTPVVAATPTTSSIESPSSSESHPSPVSPIATPSPWMGFCGTPGSFCLVRKDEKKALGEIERIKGSAVSTHET